MKFNSDTFVMLKDAQISHMTIVSSSPVTKIPGLSDMMLGIIPVRVKILINS